MMCDNHYPMNNQFKLSENWLIGLNTEISVLFQKIFQMTFYVYVASSYIHMLDWLANIEAARCIRISAKSHIDASPSSSLC